MKIIYFFIVASILSSLSPTARGLPPDYTPILMVKDVQLAAEQTGTGPVKMCGDVLLHTPTLLENLYLDIYNAHKNCHQLAKTMNLYDPPTYVCKDGTDFFTKFTGITFQQAVKLPESFKDNSAVLPSLHEQDSRALSCLEKNVKGFFVDGLGGDIQLIQDVYGYSVAGAEYLLKYETSIILSTLGYFAPETAQFYKDRAYYSFDIKSKEEYDRRIRESYDSVARFSGSFYTSTSGWAKENKDVLLCMSISPKFKTFLQYKLFGQTLASMSGGEPGKEVTTIDCNAIEEFICNSLGLVGYEFTVDFIGVAIGAALISSGAGAPAGSAVIAGSLAKLIVKLGPDALQAALKLLKKIVDSETYQRILSQSLQGLDELSSSKSLVERNRKNRELLEELLEKELVDVQKNPTEQITADIMTSDISISSLKGTTKEVATSDATKAFVESGIKKKSIIDSLTDGEELKGGREKAQRMIGGEDIYGTNFAVIKKEYVDTKENLHAIYQGYKKAAESGRGVEIIDFRLVKTSNVDTYGRPAYRMELIMEDAGDVAKRKSILSSVQSNKVEEMLTKIDELNIPDAEKLRLKQDLVNETLLALSVHPDGHMGNVFSRLKVDSNGKVRASTTSIDLDEAILDQGQVLELYKTGKLELSATEEKVKEEFLKVSREVLEYMKKKRDRKQVDTLPTATLDITADMTKSISSSSGSVGTGNVPINFENINWGQELTSLCFSHKLNTKDCEKVVKRLEWDKMFSEQAEDLGVFRIYNFHYKRDRLCELYKLLPKDCKDLISIESVLAR